MTNIFISYRRSDSQDFAGRLHDHLIRKFSASEVFIDVDNIAPGENFVEALEDRLDKTDVMLVVIGTNWLTATDEAGRRRLDHPQDYVRQEIAKALEQEIEIIPVLSETATMPKTSDLPDELSALALRNGVWLRHNSFARDVQRLAKEIKEHAKRFGSHRWKEFGDSIAREYDKHFVLSGTGEDYKLQLLYGSETSIDTFFHSHLLKDAIVNLIVEADTGGWMKHEKELQPEAFWDAILKAVVTSYRIEYGFAFEDKSDAEVLRMYIENLE